MSKDDLTGPEVNPITLDESDPSSGTAQLAKRQRASLREQKQLAAKQAAQEGRNRRAADGRTHHSTRRR